MILNNLEPIISFKELNIIVETYLMFLIWSKCQYKSKDRKELINSLSGIKMNYRNTTLNYFITKTHTYTYT